MLFIILLSKLMILLSALKFDRASHFWQDIELASSLQSDFRYTVNWSWNWLFNLNAVKTQLVLSDFWNKLDVYDAKMDGPVLDEKFLKCWNCLPLLIWMVFIHVFIYKTVSKKFEALFLYMEFFSHGAALLYLPGNSQLTLRL